MNLQAWPSLHVISDKANKYCLISMHQTRHIIIYRWCQGLTLANFILTDRYHSCSLHSPNAKLGDLCQYLYLHHVHLSACNSLPITEQIFHEIWYWEIFTKNCQPVPISIKIRQQYWILCMKTNMYFCKHFKYNSLNI